MLAYISNPVWWCCFARQRPIIRHQDALTWPSPDGVVVQLTGSLRGGFHVDANGVNQALAASSPILVGKRRVSEAKQCETGAEFRNLR